MEIKITLPKGLAASTKLIEEVAASQLKVSPIHLKDYLSVHTAKGLTGVPYNCLASVFDMLTINGVTYVHPGKVFKYVAKKFTSLIRKEYNPDTSPPNVSK